ncbi:MAG: glutamate synthase subunit beta [Tepidisphaerales bacterium]
MGKPTGFKEYPRQTPPKRPVELRVLDWDEVYLPLPEPTLREQGARCMDCGVPFCNNGCPLGNKIPDWNDLVYRGQWKEALESLLSTNNFPEWTGRICPAPCEEACVLALTDKPVAIKTIEQAIVDKGFEMGWIVPRPPAARTGKKVAVVGSGPAGLAAAQQLNRAGHLVTVFERADRPGGLLLYGIPDFKMDKSTVERRVRLLEAEGITFKCHANVGVNVPIDDLRREFDAVLLCAGACKARDLDIPGRDLKGIHLAMQYLPLPTKMNLGDAIFEQHHIDARDKHVVIIGGGDTAADCLGTAHRQKAASVTQINIYPRPPEERTPEMAPWPYWPAKLHSWPAHEEGGVREWAIVTKAFLGDEHGHVRGIRCARLEYQNIFDRRTAREIPGSEFDIRCDLCLIAIGFAGPEKEGMVEQLGLALDSRGNIKVDRNYATSVPGVYAAGDMRRGQSLVVWAISEGRQAARCIDEALMGRSDLPALDLLG